MKKKRHDMIRRLVSQNEYYTQEQLQEALQQENIYVTQATLSRDIREINLVKQPRDGKRSCYTLPTHREERPTGFWCEAVLGVDYAMNTVVVQCKSGAAQAVGAALDAMGRSEIVGTLAGDDTVFILLRNEEQAKEFTEFFSEIAKLEGDKC